MLRKKKKERTPHMANSDHHHWKSIQELFELQSKQTPNVTAVVDGSFQKTYAELSKESDAISRAIQAIGVARNDLVAILMEPSYDHICTTLGILKSGAGFLPISTDLPEESIVAILSDATPRLLLTDQKQFARIPSNANITKIMLTDMVDPLMWGEWTESSVIPTQQTDVAFATYTSGTTGEPKGVLQTQLAMVTSYESRHKFQPYQQGERVACNIFFMWEFLRPLLQGATCYVIPDLVIYTPRKLADFLAINQITEVLITPSVLQALVSSSKGPVLKERLRLLRTIWLNGEVVTHELVLRARGHLPETVRILNTYSICECHDVANYDTTWLPPDTTGPIPVGYPTDGVKVMVMPIGTKTAVPQGSGELYIGGNGLANGYLGRPDLTLEKFIQIGTSRFYATGDLAEIQEDNLILIHGRCDAMVKIRGYSVSLGAIEQALRTHCNASEAVVLANGDHLAQHLTAYLVRGENSSWGDDTLGSYNQDLRAQLLDHLPAHMIPTKFIELEAIPINLVTGKADHKALAAMDIPQPHDSHLIDSASDSFESILWKLWCRSLEVDHTAINEDANFFDLGGHSLSAVTLTLDIEDFLGTELEGTEVYEYPIFRDFLSYLSQDKDDTKDDHSSLRFWDDAAVPLSDFLHLKQNEAGVPPAGLHRNPAILITGATGFLGSFLLDSVVRNFDQDTKIYCLIRKTDQMATQDRLRNTALNLSITTLPMTGDRVIALEGDIEKPCLGLKEDIYEKLSEEVTSVFHCAANVNLQYGYPELRNSIVIGTREILKFATHRNGKSVHYISSNAVFPAIPGRLYSDDTDITSMASAIHGGYSQAKWVADRLAQRARESAVPVNIYRPGNIGPHTYTGAFNRKDLQTMVLKACMVVQAAPLETDWQFEMTPVDLVVETIVQAALSESLGRNYNIVQEIPFSASLVFSRLLAHRYIRKFIPLDEWFLQVAAIGKESRDADLMIVGSAKKMANHALTNMASFACENFLLTQHQKSLSRLYLQPDYIDHFLREMNRSFFGENDRFEPLAPNTHIRQESTL